MVTFRKGCLHVLGRQEDDGALKSLACGLLASTTSDLIMNPVRIRRKWTFYYTEDSYFIILCDSL